MEQCSHINLCNIDCVTKIGYIKQKCKKGRPIVPYDCKTEEAPVFKPIDEVTYKVKYNYKLKEFKNHDGTITYGIKAIIYEVLEMYCDDEDTSIMILSNFIGFDYGNITERPLSADSVKLLNFSGKFKGYLNPLPNGESLVGNFKGDMYGNTQ